ncbi:MAG: hypothetical protein NVS1B14_01590 [Vulcanimicrobiaceae bacterium]
MPAIFEAVRRRLFLAALCAAFFCGTAPQERSHGAGTFVITTARGPYITAAAIPLTFSGVAGTPALTLTGPGSIENGVYHVPPLRRRQTALITAATRDAYALRELELVPPPSPHRALIAVATYYGGIALHSTEDFSLIGIVQTPGAAGDVAFDSAGGLYAPITNGTTLTSILRKPWTVKTTEHVAFGNEVVVDPGTGDVFVSNRDIGASKGAVTRISNGAVETMATGITAEGLALDPVTRHLFVGNVNDGSVLEIDLRRFRAVRRIPSVARTFGLALDSTARRLYVVSNQNRQMRRNGGYAAVIDLRPPYGRIAARSGNMPFPVGAAFDGRTHTLFVTDEDSGNVFVLDGTTLRARHDALRACSVPWRPRIDAARRRLYVPCAQANRVAVFDVDRLKAVHGSPFATADYPLGVALWNPE